MSSGRDALRAHDPEERRIRFGVEDWPHQSSPPASRLLAGAAEVDITPPPGLPKAGYSANARDGEGFRSRLRARVIHLRHEETSLAIVACDLLGGSSVLQRLVAERIAASTDVPLGGLMIGATHTHAGPGQFSGTDFYNRFASNRPGFDPRWSGFLVDQIAGAAEQAVAERAPARAALGKTEVWGLTRNRSLAPHVCNETVADERLEAQRRYAAINPWLHLLRVDTEAGDGGLDPLACLAVFSVHGTGVPQSSWSYNADLWAYLVGALKAGVEHDTSGSVVVGAIEGTHADVAPAIRPGRAGHVESHRVGRDIGRAGVELFHRLEGALSADQPLGFALREVDLDAGRRIDHVELPDRPAVGAALVAGAYENTTPIIHRIPPFKPGTRKPWRTRHPQGAKWVLGGPLQRVLLRTKHFPRIVPLQILRIGSAALVGLPFEITVETGRRLEAAVGERVAGLGVDQVIVSSVANGYMGYAATPEEYDLQHYEGGHTLYGPETQPFLTAHAARLAEQLAKRPEVTDVVADRQWDLRAREFLTPTAQPSGPNRSAAAPVAFTDMTQTRDAFWEYRWRDVAPEALHWHEPIVSVEMADGDDEWVPAVHLGRVVDDAGLSIGVTHIGAAGGDGGTGAGAHEYAARWHHPDLRLGRRHRFVIEPNNGRPRHESPSFD